MSFSPVDQGTHPFDWRAQTTPAQALASVDHGDFPETFPYTRWNETQTRLMYYNRWFTGEALAEVKGKTETGETVYRFPLQMNTLRTIARKHAAVLLGEETFDSPRPMVNTLVKARQRLKLRKRPTSKDIMASMGQMMAPPAGQPAAAPDGKTPAKGPAGQMPGNVMGLLGGSLGMQQEDEQDIADREQAELAQTIVNEVWMDSNGRSNQIEAATLQQILGGWVWKVQYDKNKINSRIPVTIKSIKPQFFLPIYAEGEYWDLLEAWVAYKIPASTAERQFGVTGLGADSMVMYVEHWTKEKYSIYVNGDPVSATKDGVTVTYDGIKNWMGFVPFVYIPHLREGMFDGSSHVPDVEGLIKEHNARSANIGMAIKDTVERKRYSRNLRGDATPKDLAKGVKAIDLGSDNPASKHEPDVFWEDPINFSAGLTDYPAHLFQQLMRDLFVSDITFGEDEGSQRSALTLAFRMWPTTSHVRQERAHWTEGLNKIAEYILRIVVAKKKSIPDVADLDDDILRRVTFSQDWLPMIPRDREQQVNEVILRFQAGLLSPELALEMLGDVPYVSEEILRIKAWLTFQSSLGAAGASDGSTQAGEGAPSNTTKPEVSDGLQEE